MLDRPHLRRHLDALGNMLVLLRTLPPDGPRFKLWLGDLVEFVHDAFGADAEALAAVRAVLLEHPIPGETDEATRTLAYLKRLDAFGHLLLGFSRRLADPLPLIDVEGNGHTPHRRPRGDGE